MKLLLSVLVLGVAGWWQPIAANTTLCPAACDPTPAPVCGQQQQTGQFRTFNSSCALTEFNCNNPSNRFRWYSATACLAGTAL